MRKLAAVTALVGGLATIGHGGTWSLLNQNLLGSATGTATGPPYVPSNSVNWVDITNSSYTFPYLSEYIDMWSGVFQPGNNSATAHAWTTNTKMRFLFQWTPAPGMTLETDPPQPLTVVLRLNRWHHIFGKTGAIFATVSATSKVEGDGIVFPTVSGSATGILQPFTPPPFSEVVKIIKTLSGGDISGDIATLNVNLKTETEASHIVSGGELSALFSRSTLGLFPPRPLLARINSRSLFVPPVEAWGNAGIEPTVSLLDIVLIVADPKVFPGLFPIPSTNGLNRYVFDSSQSGVLQNPDWQSKVVGESPSVFLPNTTYTSFSVGSSQVVPDTKSIAGDIIRQKFTYTGLPANSTDFGNKQVIMVCTGPVSSTQKARVQVFFAKTATNHPSPDAPTKAGTTPNWYFYWRQTAAGSGYQDNFYGGNSGFLTGATIWDTGTSDWIALIYDGACGSLPWYAGTQPGTTSGIDLFAITVRHEKVHLDDFNQWWPTGHSSANDPDSDYIPTSFGGNSNFEATVGDPYHTNGYDPALHLTPGVSDTMGYGGDFDDGEDYAQHRQDLWTKGSADKMDWSKPGKQWT